MVMLINTIEDSYEIHLSYNINLDIYLWNANDKPIASGINIIFTRHNSTDIKKTLSQIKISYLINQ